MLLAELEIRHSRAVAPTRRVALGQVWLPSDPPPGFGGILLGAIVACHLSEIEPELRSEFLVLVDDLEAGKRIAQPRLRHRFQSDVVGLDRTVHKLAGTGERMSIQSAGRGRPVPQLLGAVYAAATMHAKVRPAVFAAIRKGARWSGDVDERFLGHLSDPTSNPPSSWRRFPTDERWALQVMEFAPEAEPERDEIQRRFRALVRAAHPDHGADTEGAGQRILELTEARRILLD